MSKVLYKRLKTNFFEEFFLDVWVKVLNRLYCLYLPQVGKIDDVNAGPTMMGFVISNIGSVGISGGMSLK